MFQLLFKYPSTVFTRGQFVLLGGWPAWLLVLLAMGAAALIAWLVLRRRTVRPLLQSAVLWSLETALVVLVLVLLWQPAVMVSALQSQQNVVAVVIDDSRSMAAREDGSSRKDKVVAALNSPVLEALRKKFQVRLYRLSGQLERIERLDQLNAAGPSTRIGDGLKQLAAESVSVPVGAVVLLSDGSDNSGGIDAATIAEIRRRRIPVHSVGFGRERLDHDVEVTDVQVPSRVLSNARVAAQVSFRQAGFANQHAKLTVRADGHVLASRDVTFQADGLQQTEPITFFAGQPGARNLEVTLEPSPGEQNTRNNSLTRVINIDPGKLRILYVEGEPRWEFKFIRRALEDDKSIQLVTMLRTTQNKVYRQGIANPHELEEGFPAKAEELFGFRGLIIGGIEANYFTAAQQEIIKQFVDRRGGGLLFLAGRTGLTEGGYAASAFADLLPVTLSDKKTTFFRDPATAQLTRAGRDSMICRLEDDPEKNAARWPKLPYLANFQEVREPKPGAAVLAEYNAAGHGRFPLLTIENYGAGRTALLATAGTWRWQMLQPLEDKSHEIFWQQLLRWLVTDSPGRVSASTAQTALHDNGRNQLHAVVKDATFLADGNATVEARVLGPDGSRTVVPLPPDPARPGEYAAEWDAEKPGSYLAEIIARRGEEELGRDVATFRREDGVAEDFHVEQNRELLERLSEQTGGRYYTASEIGRLPDEIVYSDAGISVREARELWNMPIIFALMLLLRTGDWALRRKWGVV